MLLDEILNNSEYNQMLEKYMSDFYFKYHFQYDLEYEEFKQEIYIYLLKNLKLYDKKRSSLSTFIYMCLKSKCTNLKRDYNTIKRKTKVSSLNVIIDSVDNNIELIDSITDESTNIEKEVIENTDISILDYLLEYYKNDEQTKKVIILIANGYSKKDICEIMGFSRATLLKITRRINNNTKVKHFIKMNKNIL